MNVIRPSYKILTKISEGAIEEFKICEEIARECYKSEDLITEDGSSAIDMIRKLLDREHEAMIEHIPSLSVKFTVDRGITHELVRMRLFSFAQESTRYCVAGDTSLKCSNYHLKLTVKDIYDNIQKSKNGAWKRIKIRQVNEDTGELIYSNIKNCYKTGIKEVYKIITSLGYELKCTADHQIYTPLGYKKLNELSVNDQIYVNGITLPVNELYKNYEWLYYQNITMNKTFVQIAKEFGYNVSTLKKWAKTFNIPKKGTGYFNVGRSPWNKGLNENDDSRVLKQANALRKFHCNGRHDNEKIILKRDTSIYQKYKKNKCELCGSIDGLEVHHKDFNHYNNDPDNLITVCESCHQRVHSRNLGFITPDKIISIEKLGEEEVYDIEMDSQYHNFIANGVVVHNCNYNKGKFGSEITVIRPFFFDTDENKYGIWYNSCLEAEKRYMKLIESGAKPEEARSVLPNSTKATITVTGNYREWRHFFRLRTEKFAHPQMREITIPLLKELQQKIPFVFDDILPDGIDKVKSDFENIKTMVENNKRFENVRTVVLTGEEMNKLMDYCKELYNSPGWD